MQKCVVYGSGGMGREVAETTLAAAAAGQPLELLGFLDDSPDKRGQEILGLPILGPGEWIAKHPETQVILGIGHPLSRYRVVQRILDHGGQFATVLHPSVTVMPSARIDTGCVIFAGCIVSSGAHIGSYSYINYNTVVSHDAVVGDFACVMGQVALSGNVTVGEGAFIGVGTSTRQGVSIGEWSIIGAGACIVRDVPALCVAVGVPAQPRRFYSSLEEMPPF